MASLAHKIDDRSGWSRYTAEPSPMLGLGLTVIVHLAAISAR